MAVIVCRNASEVHRGEIAGGAASARFTMLSCCSCTLPLLSHPCCNKIPVKPCNTHKMISRGGVTVDTFPLRELAHIIKPAHNNVTSPCSKPPRYTLHYPRCIVVAWRPPAAYHPHRRCLSGFIVHVHGHGHYTNSPVSDTNCHTCLVHASFIVACAVDDSIGI